MARAYGLSLDEIKDDPAFPLVLAFGAAALNSTEFRDEVRALLDRHQPDLVLIESFYNFHPADVDAPNLYARGQVIDAYHKLIRTECEGATSLMTDHYRSTNTARTLDLDAISMAGQAENADSWIMRHHRPGTNVAGGQFPLRVEFGSRQWGATRWNVDWHLGAFDHDLGSHDGEISWDVAADVRPAVAPATEDAPPAVVFANDVAGYVYMREFVRGHPNMTETAIKAAIRDDTKLTHKRLGELWGKAQEIGYITRRTVRREEIDPRTGADHPVTRTVWFPGRGQQTLAEDQAAWGAGAVAPAAGRGVMTRPARLSRQRPRPMGSTVTVGAARMS